LGVTVVPINTRLSVVEIDHILEDARPCGLIRHSSLPAPTVRTPLKANLHFAHRGPERIVCQALAVRIRSKLAGFIANCRVALFRPAESSMSVQLGSKAEQPADEKSLADRIPFC
jgi:acyl-CoA synthetase (AMP-forming)/AMP-acid ligase II